MTKEDNKLYKYLAKKIELFEELEREMYLRKYSVSFMCQIVGFNESYFNRPFDKILRIRISMNSTRTV